MLGLGIGITSGVLRQSLTPARLFADGSNGLLWDFSTTSPLYSDNAGATPLTAPDTGVGLVADRSKGLVLGPELVTNGDFSAGTTGWSATGSASLSVVSGALRVTNSAAVTGGATQTFNTVAGTTYRWTYYVDPATSGGAVIRVRDGGTLAVISTATRTVAGSYTILFVATGSTTQLNCINSSSTAGVYHDVDNISVKELPGNHGTQSNVSFKPKWGRAPVSRRNLLQQTADFSAAVWSKIKGGLGADPIVTSGFTDPDGGNTAWRLVANSGGSGASDYSVLRQSFTSTTGARSVYIKSNTGAPQIIYFGAPLSGSALIATTTWTRVSYNAATASAFFDIGAFPNAAGGGSGTTADVLIWHPQSEPGSTATPYQAVTSTYDMTEAGVPSYGFIRPDRTDDVLSTVLTLAQTGDVAVFGRNGSWLETARAYTAGATFSIGPTTVTGLTAGLLAALGDIVGIVAIGRTLTAAELASTLSYFKARGAAGWLVAGAGQAANGDFATDTIWTKGTGWTIGSGVATKTAGVAALLSEPQTLIAGVSYLIEFTLTRSAGQIGIRFEGGTTISGSAYSASGTYSQVLQAVIGNNTFAFSTDTVFAGTVDNVSIKPLTVAP